MQGEISGDVLSYPNGVCPRHNVVCISMEGRPTCLRCVADAARANAKPAGVNTEEDPGHGAMKGIIMRPPKEGVTPDAAPQNQVDVRKTSTISLQNSSNFASHIQNAIDFLGKAPMPKDLAHFKAVQRAIATLTKITGEVN